MCLTQTGSLCSTVDERAALRASDKSFIRCCRRFQSPARHAHAQWTGLLLVNYRLHVRAGPCWPETKADWMQSLAELSTTSSASGSLSVTHRQVGGLQAVPEVTAMPHDELCGGAKLEVRHQVELGVVGRGVQLSKERAKDEEDLVLVDGCARGALCRALGLQELLQQLGLQQLR